MAEKTSSPQPTKQGRRLVRFREEKKGEEGKLIRGYNGNSKGKMRRGIHWVGLKEGERDFSFCITITTTQ